MCTAATLVRAALQTRVGGPGLREGLAPATRAKQHSCGSPTESTLALTGRWNFLGVSPRNEAGPLVARLLSGEPGQGLEEPRRRVLHLHPRASVCPNWAFEPIFPRPSRGFIPAKCVRV